MMAGAQMTVGYRREGDVHDVLDDCGDEDNDSGGS